MNPTSHSSSVPSPSVRSGVWLAALLLLMLGVLQLYYCDLTLHGPDQIRDVETVRLWLHQGQWPRSSTPFNGGLFLPPGFYYLLGLPLLVVDSEVSIFAAFGLVYVVCIGCAWHMLRRHLGDRVALGYLVLCMPIFGGIYTHSAWNPALVTGLSSLVLTLWVRILHEPKPSWFALVLLMFLLLQVHPSAAPLGVGLGLQMLSRPGVLRQRGTWGSIFLVVVVSAGWVVWAKPWSLPKVMLAAPPPPAAEGWAALPGRLFDAGKWWDALAMPYHMVSGIPLAGGAVKAAAAVLLGVMLIGVVLGTAQAIRSKASPMRWVVLALGLWWVIAMALLAHGAFWHLDVAQPWMALVAAYGWARASEQWCWPSKAWLGNVAMVAALALAGQWGLYLHFDAHGKLDILANTSFFPRIPGVDRLAPSFSFRYLHAMQNYLRSESICQSQLRGLYWMLVRDMTNRQFDAECRNPVGGAFAPNYVIEPRHPAVAWDLTRGLNPVAMLPGAAVYVLEPLPMRVSGQAGGNFFTDQRVDYMTFAPARHEQGISVQLDVQGPAVVRVSLRCTDETTLPQPESWVLNQAKSMAPPRAEHAKYMGSNYHTLEWTLQPVHPGIPLSLATPPVATECDVSAVARALP